MAPGTILLGCLCALGTFFVGTSPSRGEEVFLRGDANADGKVSISDVVLIRRYLFDHGIKPTCLRTADLDDSDAIDINDFIIIIINLYVGAGPPDVIRPPFPDPGPDPSPGAIPCESYQPIPAEGTDDLLQIGDVAAKPGESVAIPLYLTNSVDVDAFQIVVKYDPTIFNPNPGTGSGIVDLTGTPWADDSGGPFIGLKTYPDEGVFILGVVGSLLGKGHEGADEFPYPPIPPGQGQLIAKILGTVPPGAQVGTAILLDPTNGPLGQGIHPPFNYVNEITHKGAAMFVSFLPRTKGGTLAIIADIGFFTRGDANSDRLVDTSDAISIFSFLFQGGEAPRCMDAADADDSGKLDLTDGVTILNKLFLGTGEISAPYPLQGTDPTLDDFPSCR